MTTTIHSTTITPEGASEPGAIAGFAIVCTCGDRHSVSLPGMARQYSEAHLRFHATNDPAPLEDPGFPVWGGR